MTNHHVAARAVPSFLFEEHLALSQQLHPIKENNNSEEAEANALRCALAKLDRKFRSYGVEPPLWTISQLQGKEPM